MINVAVLGYGTVGSGVVEVIEGNKEMISKRSGDELNVKYILDLRDFPGDPYEKKVVHDVNQIMEDEEVSIVCEVMGGVGAAYKFTRMALEKGKSVCTSNKELVAKYGPELLKLAEENHCSYFFEASVGGGIPIIRPLNDCLTAEKVDAITGILNGTTNYILTKMEKEGADFGDVLKQAQELGYAELHPEADVEGFDACRKIAILSSLMMGKNVDSEKIFTEGITKITADDFRYAKTAGKTIKLLGMSEVVDEDTALAIVAPFMISKEHPLSVVNDVFNAIFVTGNMLGDSMYYGRGAGKLPTASAVVADVVEAARNLGTNVKIFWDAEEVKLAEVSETQRSFYIRVAAAVKERAAKVFAGSESIVWEGRTEDAAFITPVMSEKEFYAKCEELGDAVLSQIRLY